MSEALNPGGSHHLPTRITAMAMLTVSWLASTAAAHTQWCIHPFHGSMEHFILRGAALVHAVQQGCVVKVLECGRACSPTQQ